MSFYQHATSNCTNCGGSGHTFRMCIEPVSSYGVLVFRWVSKSADWMPYRELCKNSQYSQAIADDLVPEILMIQRKDSLGFMDIMRGKYKLSDPEYIKKQMKCMTKDERDRLLSMDFDEIWHRLWGADTESSQRYAHDRIISKQKLAELRAGVEGPNGQSYCLADLLRQEPALYNTPEWGFPKGRRDIYETDIKCAYRELEEETGIPESDVWKAINVAPLIEQFYGSNNIHYRHTYYIAQYIGDSMICFDKTNNEMTREIGNITWKNLDEALILLRPENVEKRGILIQLANLLRNFAPVLREPLEGQLMPFENQEGEQQEKYVFIKQVQPGDRASRTNTLQWRTAGGASRRARPTQPATGRGGAVSRHR